LPVVIRVIIVPLKAVGVYEEHIVWEVIIIIDDVPGNHS
jgi:hypothetical protein